MKVVSGKGLKDNAESVEAGVAGPDPKVVGFLVKQYPNVAGRKLEIKHLWGNCYRLNFWGEKQINPKKPAYRSILESKFVRVTESEDGQYGCEIK